MGFNMKTNHFYFRHWRARMQQSLTYFSVVESDHLSETNVLNGIMAQSFGVYVITYLAHVSLDHFSWRHFVCFKCHFNDVYFVHRIEIQIEISLLHSYVCVYYFFSVVVFNHKTLFGANFYDYEVRLLKFGAFSDPTYEFSSNVSLKNTNTVCKNLSTIMNSITYVCFASTFSQFQLNPIYDHSYHKQCSELHIHSQNSKWINKSIAKSFSSVKSSGANDRVRARVISRNQCQNA